MRRRSTVPSRRSATQSAGAAVRLLDAAMRSVCAPGVSAQFFNSTIAVVREAARLDEHIRSQGALNEGAIASLFKPCGALEMSMRRGTSARTPGHALVELYRSRLLAVAADDP
jgi:hypothetical protein